VSPVSEQETPTGATRGLILGIETSCDETAAAVVAFGEDVLSSVVSSQVDLHARFGGVVPEIASRAHLELLIPVVAQAMVEAGVSGADLDAVAVTHGPGLIGALLVGLSGAKGLALAWDLPLIGVNHLEAHLYAAQLEHGRIGFPQMVLLVSGGHTQLVAVAAPGEYELVGGTVDDAAGEAFDKVARFLGLGYPGGPAIDRMARQAARADAVAFPKGSPRPGNPALAGLRAGLCVSFSGLKTALLYHLRSHPPQDQNEVAAVAAAYQEAIVAALAERCERALRGGRYAAFAVGGGVSLNRRLRERLTEVARAAGVRLLLAEPRFCGDNAAMIAGLAGSGGGVRGAAAQELDVTPALAAGEGETAW